MAIVKSDPRFNGLDEPLSSAMFLLYADELYTIYNGNYTAWTQVMVTSYGKDYLVICGILDNGILDGIVVEDRTTVHQFRYCKDIYHIKPVIDFMDSYYRN